MTDTNDIDMLLKYLSRAAEDPHTKTPIGITAAGFYAALTALIAERNALKQRVPLEVSDTWARRLVHKDQIINRLRYEHELKEKQNIDNGLAVVDLKRRVAELEKELLVDTSAMLAAMRKEGGGA